MSDKMLSLIKDLKMYKDRQDIWIPIIISRGTILDDDTVGLSLRYPINTADLFEKDREMFMDFLKFLSSENEDIEVQADGNSDEYFYKFNIASNSKFSKDVLKPIMVAWGKNGYIPSSFILFKNNSIVFKNFLYLYGIFRGKCYSNTDRKVTRIFGNDNMLRTISDLILYDRLVNSNEYDLCGTIPTIPIINIRENKKSDLYKDKYLEIKEDMTKIIFDIN